MLDDRDHSQWCETQFKIDTGADVTAVYEETFHKIQMGTLAAAQKVLCGPDH